MNRIMSIRTWIVVLAAAGAMWLSAPSRASARNAEQRLVGNWMGGMQVDEQALARKFQEQQDPQSLQTALGALRSLKLEMAFHPDGKLQALAILNENEKTSNGTWNIVEQREDGSVVLETTMREEGAEETKTEQAVLEFEDADTFLMTPANQPPQLRDVVKLKFTRFQRQ